MGDGNCMLCAIAHQLYGSDQQHSQLQLTLQENRKNVKGYERLWIGNDTFSTHVNQTCVKLAEVWDTQVQLQATSA